MPKCDKGSWEGIDITGTWDEFNAKGQNGKVRWKGYEYMGEG